MTHINNLWPEYTVGMIGYSISGVSFRPQDTKNSHADGLIACFRTSNIQQSLTLQDVLFIPESFVRSEHQVLQDGDILISTANSDNLVGKCVIVENLPYKSTLGGFISAFRVNKKIVIPRFFYYWLSSALTQARLRALSRRTTNIANLAMSDLVKLKIPLPPLSEQQRIVEILQEAEEIRRLQAEAEAKTTELIPSLFLNHFGNLSNAKHLPLCELLDGIQTGWSPNALDRPAKKGAWGVLRLSAVSTCRYLEMENKELPSDINIPHHLEIQEGDVILSRKNTRELVGACAYVWETRKKLIFPDLIFRLNLKPTAPVSAKYLWALLSSPGFSQRVRKLADGAAASMPNIPKNRLEKLQIPIPSIQLIKAFDEALINIRHQEKELLKSYSKQDALSNSLSAHAFSGQLTAEWRKAQEELLVQEAIERDVSLKITGEKLFTSLNSQSIVIKEINYKKIGGIFTDLNREQYSLLDGIQRMIEEEGSGPYFTAERIAAYLTGPLARHPQRIESHLIIFAARGIIIPVSRMRDAIYGPIFATCYRFPVINESTSDEKDDIINFRSDDIRMFLMEKNQNLAKRKKR